MEAFVESGAASGRRAWRSGGLRRVIAPINRIAAQAGAYYHVHRELLRRRASSARHRPPVTHRWMRRPGGGWTL
jgi:hypothetical protein